MSEVTELTNEQLLVEYRTLGTFAGFNESRVEELHAELLRRLSTQGAGPRCPKCGSEEIKLTGRACAFEDGVQIGVRCPKCDFKSIPKCLADFAAFFRAPSDPLPDATKEISKGGKDGDPREHGREEKG